MFKSIKLKIMQGRKLNPFKTASVIQDHEDRLGSLENGEGGGSGGASVDLTEINQEINSLKTSKANANHSHTTSSISDVDTAQIVVTYQDSSTETLNVLVKTE